MRQLAIFASSCLLLATYGNVAAQEVPPPPDRPVIQGSSPDEQDLPVKSEAPPEEVKQAEQHQDEERRKDEAAAEQEMNRPDPWLDRTQEGVHGAVWRSARWVDRMFGVGQDDQAYQEASGSLAPALLYDEFNGFKPRVRFRVNVPLPQLDERVNAFVGRVDPDEFVTEQSQDSGAFRRQYGPMSEDETILGIAYREPPRPGGRFDAGLGVRVRFPLDPYIKGSYRYTIGSMDRVLFNFRETIFWQNSEDLGSTTRVDLERIVAEKWLVRYTASATYSQESEGVKGYTALTALHALGPRKALAFEVGMDGASDAEVPLHEYGFKAAYRQNVLREWLVLELRTSLTWPREEEEERRESSWGVGIGFEMFFGTEQFLARPVTF